MVGVGRRRSARVPPADITGAGTVAAVKLAATPQGLPQPEDETARTSLAWVELNRQFAFFHASAGANRLFYLGMRMTVLIAGALVPIMALTSGSKIVVAALGALVVVAEGTAQLTQVHDHWIRYRRTAEALRREAVAFCTHTGAYHRAVTMTPEQRLATRLLDVSAQESSAWEETVRAVLVPHPNDPTGS